ISKAVWRIFIFSKSFTRQLLVPGYQEIWYTADGERKSSSPANNRHCFYHGEVRGVDGSSVAVSTCSGLRGLISLNTSVSYLIEPLSAAGGEEQHAVFRAESLQLPRGSCLHHPGNTGHKEELDDFIHGMMSPQLSRVSSETIACLKRNFEKTKLKLLEAANLVDKYYKVLNIRVALIGLEVWTNVDMISVSDNPHSTLAAFLSWRSKQLRTLPNDNAQLITGRAFQGTTIGLAPLKAMCSDYQSGGVNTDHSESAVGVAATMAHEMGHNFGMTHDSTGCCQARAEDGGCIMAAATGHPFPRVFNDCNLKELRSYLTSGGGKCLFNLPNTRVMYGGQRCGNEVFVVSLSWVFPCILSSGAECAHGVCCHKCKLKSPGVLCRAPSGSCDLPEYCDGRTESCPANFYLVDGTTCASEQAYCYTGMCLTLEQQCQSLWGQDGRPAPELCFKKVNEAGDMFGNCGKDLLGRYKTCKDRNAKCGKIQCLTSVSKPIENNAVRIETTVSVGNEKIRCMGTHVYKAGQVDEDTQSDTLDPGLVMTGTKCGVDSICFNGECRNASFLRADECNNKCNGHGLCNNNHNCHCDAGWAPPLCEKKGFGGSLDSGPVINHSETALFCVDYNIYTDNDEDFSLQSSSIVPPRQPPTHAAGSPPDELVQPLTQPRTTPQRQTPPQVKALPSMKSEQAQKQAPPPPSGLLASRSPKNNSQPSTVPKPRPDPPNRPPPPCPVNKPLLVMHF
uniref:ADAM metallopeptidase domain 19 n=1 Tax=Takifugu rubripes TaxID=31033 RepID=A0A674N4F5_TAKRU